MDDLKEALAQADGIVILKPDDLEEMLTRASRRGAREALHSVGLDGEDARTDVADMRDVVGFIRSIRSSFGKSLGATMPGLIWLPFGVINHVLLA